MPAHPLYINKLSSIVKRLLFYAGRFFILDIHDHMSEKRIKLQFLDRVKCWVLLGLN